MKKIVLSIFLFLSFLSYNNAQLWIDSGFKFNYGASYLLNSNMSNDATIDQSLSSMYGFGAKIGIHFNIRTGIMIEGMYGASNQNLTYQTTEGTFDNKLNWKHIDLNVLFRVESGRAFVEFGGQFAKVGDVTHQDENITGVTDFDPFYEDSYIAGLLGFGTNIAGGNGLNITSNVRFGYAFTDLVSEEGQAAGYPNPSGTQYNEVEKTLPLFATIGFEVNFGIGYFAKQQCGGRTAFIRFD